VRAGSVSPRSVSPRSVCAEVVLYDSSARQRHSVQRFTKAPFNPHRRCSNRLGQGHGLGMCQVLFYRDSINLIRSCFSCLLSVDVFPRVSIGLCVIIASSMVAARPSCR